MPATRQRLLSLWVFAALRSGNPYVYGGSFSADPRASTDCSGAVFSAAALLAGLNPHRRWGSTETLRLARLNGAPAPCGLIPAASKDSVPADAPLKVGVTHGPGGGGNSHTACSFYLDGRRFDFESRGTPGVLLDSGARGWDHPLFTDFWYLPGPVTDDPDVWPLPPAVVYGPLDGPETQLSGLTGEPAAWMSALRDFQQRAGAPVTGAYDTATRSKAEDTQHAAGLPVTGLVDEATWRAARAAEHEPAPAVSGEPAMWADVSEWQGKVLDDSYPHRVFCFRTNDRDLRDLKATANARAAAALLDAGRLDCVIAYYFFRPGGANCDMHKTILEDAGLWGEERLVTMVDVEGDGGRVRGDQSPEANDEVARLRHWHGNPRRVIGYWNLSADPDLWRIRPEGLRLVIPRHNQRPGDLSEIPEPYRSEAIAHQHTDRGLCPPFGACDMNQSLIPLPALLDALGVPPTQKETPVTVMTDNELNRRFDNIEAKLDRILAQQGPWPQTGNRTLLDTAAAVGEKLGVPGCRDVLAEPLQAA